MQTHDEPLILILDLEALSLKSAEELLPLLKNHILHIVMGQIRDIEERERLSRKLCRKFGGLFAANDICVLPRPLSTCQSDSRFLAPRHLAHLIGTTKAAVDSSSSQARSEVMRSSVDAQEVTPQPVQSENAWRRLARALGVMSLLFLLTLRSLGPGAGFNTEVSSSAAGSCCRERGIGDLAWTLAWTRCQGDGSPSAFSIGGAISARGSKILAWSEANRRGMTRTQAALRLERPRGRSGAVAIETAWGPVPSGSRWSLNGQSPRFRFAAEGPGWGTFASRLSGVQNMGLTESSKNFSDTG